MKKTADDYAGVVPPRSLRLFVQVLLVATLLLRALLIDAAHAESGDPPAAPSFRLGVHMDLTYDGYDWRRAKAITAVRDLMGPGAISRNSLAWNTIELRPGKRDWSRVDAVVDELRAKNMVPLFTIYGSPCWMNGSTPGMHDCGNAVPQNPKAFRKWVDAYAAFVHQAAQRYRGRVSLWEIGNEENEYFFWRPQQSVQQFTIWYKALYNAVRSAQPRAKIAIGGVAGLTASCCITGKAFLRAVLQDPTVRFDAIALHPYTNIPPMEKVRGETNFPDIANVTAMITDMRGPTPIWLTEFGWPSDKWGLDNQAEFLSTALNYIDDHLPDVEMAVIFIDYDRPPEYFYGLFDKDFAPKPAAGAVREFLRTQRK